MTEGEELFSHPASLCEFMDHIGRVHHASLRAVLPRLSCLIEKIASQHGDAHPECLNVRYLFEMFKPALESHLNQQTDTIYPLLRRLDTEVTWRYFDQEFGNPVSTLRLSHACFVDVLAAMRSCARKFILPPGTDPSICALAISLAELERATIRYLREEEALFKRALDSAVWPLNTAQTAAA